MRDFPESKVKNAILKARNVFSEEFIKFMEGQNKKEITELEGDTIHRVDLELNGGILEEKLLWGDKDEAIGIIRSSARCCKPNSDAAIIEEVRYKAMYVLAEELGLNKDIKAIEKGRI